MAFAYVLRRDPRAAHHAGLEHAVFVVNRDSRGNGPRLGIHGAIEALNSALINASGILQQAELGFHALGVSECFRFRQCNDRLKMIKTRDPDCGCSGGDKLVFVNIATHQDPVNGA